MVVGEKGFDGEKEKEKREKRDRERGRKEFGKNRVEMKV